MKRRLPLLTFVFSLFYTLIPYTFANDALPSDMNVRGTITEQSTNDLLIASSLPNVHQQKKRILGVIRDANGEPLIGASVTEVGTTTGTITDIDGKFSLNVGTNAKLKVSYIGYNELTIDVGNQTTLQITMTEDTKQLDEVVVVGFGTQKKVNLTGAVSAVQVDETLSNRSLADVASGLQGLMPGLYVSSNSGMVGREDVTLSIRGMGSVNNTEPLIVVDGMPDVNMNRLNMADIESISVLKDAASAAVYGSRAANGVILITTRSGKNQDRVAINFTGSYASSYPTNHIEFMPDYPRALTLHQRSAATGTLESNYQYKYGTIDQWMALGMIDHLRYPNTDWWSDWIMRPHGTLNNYNVSASGGSDKANFYASIGVNDQQGLQINNDYNRYNARFNFDYKLFPNLTVGVRAQGNWTNRTYFISNGYTDPDDSSNTSGYDMQYAIAGITPYDPVSGHYGGVMAYGEDAQAFNPYTYYVNNLNHQNRQEFIPSMYLEWSPVKGLTGRLEYALNYFNQFTWSANMPNRAWNFQTNTYGSRIYVGENAGVSNSTNTGYKTQLSARINYAFKIGQIHDIQAMFAYNEEYWYQRSQSSSRNDRLHPSLHEVDAALTSIQGAGGSSWTEGLLSYVGRLNYTAKDKYLAEFTFRVDGSSRFLPGHQYGFFPSYALGWRFSEENFVKKFTDSWLYQGKLRASYGSLGRNDVSRFEQKETLTASNYMLGGQLVKGFVNKKMINKDLTWETQTVLNIGMDLGFFGGKLSAELDYYDKLTTGMIQNTQMSILLTGAYSAPRDNLGDLRDRGVDFNLTWKDRKKDFSYMINFNYARYWTKLESWNEFLGKGWVYVDMPYHFVYTYIAEGIAQTWQDVYSHTPQGISPGDVIRKDVNGDGRIGGDDKVAMPNYRRDRPHTSYALNTTFTWKGIDLALLFQGAYGRKTFWINNYNNTNIQTQRYASSYDHWTEPWSWENRDGAWPRLGGSGSNREESTFWLDDLSYLRLKNVQLGYNLPKKLLRRIFVNSFRVFVSAENMATLTSFRGIDPERSGRGSGSGGNASDVYPLIKSYAIGFNLGF